VDPEDAGRAHTISLVAGGRIRPNLEYPLAGEPCERIVPGQTRVFARDVRRLFPGSPLMAELGVEAYVGNPLENAVGERAGVMAVFFKHPLERTEFIASTLRIFAARATAELERRRVDERVREQAALLDKAQDAILVRDLEHRITYWNKSAERLYGWTAEEATGRSVAHLLYQDTTAFHEAMAQLLARGEWVGELQQVNKQGNGLVIEGRWTLVRDDRGVPRSVLAINTDITEKKKLELQFLRAQRMESIGTLAGGIAHDLNNVLAPIIMAIDLLKLSVTDERGRSMLTTMAASARRGAEMVRQVLSFARGVEGRRVEVHPRHLIREIEKIALDTFPKNIRIETRAGPDLWTVTGDPTQLHQVLINLCVNARDAMPEGGRLVVGAQNQVLDAHYAAMNIEAKAGPYVIVQIEDTGTGIPPAILDKIFDPFFTTKALGKGTGLGLSTSLAIVKSHDGFIRVYSEPGRGTRFQIYLPARPDGAGLVAAAVRSELPRGRGETVLVVDDEESIREIAQRTLEAFGYRVLLASDGAEAVTLYAGRREEIAVVLTDMMMPVMDGAATIRALLEINPGARVIAASGIAANGEVARSIGAGVRHFIPKPYTADTLLKTLRQTLDEGL
jgi:PAS domain S-box-containing protein